jgi:hypothetical protein
VKGPFPGQLIFASFLHGGTVNRLIKGLFTQIKCNTCHKFGNVTAGIVLGIYKRSCSDYYLQAYKKTGGFTKWIGLHVADYDLNPMT